MCRISMPSEMEPCHFMSITTEVSQEEVKMDEIIVNRRVLEDLKTVSLPKLLFLVMNERHDSE